MSLTLAGPWRAGWRGERRGPPRYGWLRQEIEDRQIGGLRKEYGGRPAASATSAWDASSSGYRPRQRQLVGWVSSLNRTSTCRRFRGDFRPGCQPGRDRPAAPTHQREIVEIVLHLSRRAVCTKHAGGRPYTAAHWPEVRLGVRREKAAFPVGAGPFAPGVFQLQHERFT
jgi:hypothetical protein